LIDVIVQTQLAHSDKNQIRRRSSTTLYFPHPELDQHTSSSLLFSFDR